MGVGPRVGPRAGRRWGIEPWCVSSRKVGLYELRPKRVRPKFSDASTAPAPSRSDQTECWSPRLTSARVGADRKPSHRADGKLSQRCKPPLRPLDVGDQHSGVRGSRDASLANRNRDRIVFWILVLDPCIGSSLSGTGAPRWALADVTPGN